MCVFVDICTNVHLSVHNANMHMYLCVYVRIHKYIDIQIHAHA